jgi:hypothetical protein
MLTIALGACSGSPSTYDFVAVPQFSYDHLVLAGERETLAVVRNNPFAADRDNAAVLAAMNRPVHDLSLRFSQARTGMAATPYKVVLAFGEAPRGNPCVDTSSAGGGVGAIRLHGAFCVNDYMLSRVTGAAEGITGPADGRFAELIHEVLVALLPVMDPFQRCPLSTEC